MGDGSQERDDNLRATHILLPSSIAIVGWYVMTAANPNTQLPTVLQVIFPPSTLYLGSLTFVRLNRQIELVTAPENLERTLNTAYFLAVLLGSGLGGGADVYDGLLVPQWILTTVAVGVAVLGAGVVVSTDEHSQPVSEDEYRRYLENGTLSSFIVANPSVVKDGFVVRGQNETVRHNGWTTEADIVGTDVDGTDVIVDVATTETDEVNAVEFVEVADKKYPGRARIIKATPSVTPDARRVFSESDVEVVDLGDSVESEEENRS